jgi:hypothetical protein
MVAALARKECAAIPRVWLPRYAHLHLIVVLTIDSQRQGKIMEKTPVFSSTKQGPSHCDTHPDKNEMKAIEESQEETVSRPGGFRNHPDEPTNPNEAIERHRRKLLRLE